MSRLPPATAAPHTQLRVSRQLQSTGSCLLHPAVQLVLVWDWLQAGWCLYAQAGMCRHAQDTRAPVPLSPTS